MLQQVVRTCQPLPEHSLQKARPVRRQAGLMRADPLKEEQRIIGTLVTTLSLRRSWHAAFRQPADTRIRYRTGQYQCRAAPKLIPGRTNQAETVSIHSTVDDPLNSGRPRRHFERRTVVHSPAWNAIFIQTFGPSRSDQHLSAPVKEIHCIETVWLR